MESVLNSLFGPIILEDPVVTIGSALDNRLVLSDYTVSAYHAEIRPTERGYSITDLGSAYGTFINDQRLDWNVPYLLNPEDTVCIGGTRFTYEIRETVQPGTMTGVPANERGEADTSAAGTLNRPLRRGSRRKLWIPVGIVGAVLLASVLVFFFVIRSTPDKTLDAFCNSMQKGDYQTAYSQFSPSLQKMQSEPQFQGENKITSCIHDSSTQSGGTATAHLTTVSASGTKLSGQVSLVQDNNNNWKINELPSTPSITLDAFCNAIKTKDYQTVYNQLSSRVRSQDTESDFASGLAQSGIASCTHSVPAASSTTATGSITFFSSIGQSAVYIVTLVKEENIWKIDDLTSGS